jgi:hypothetical protein
VAAGRQSSVQPPSASSPAPRCSNRPPGAWYYPNFSVAHVNLLDNTTAGSRLSAFYGNNRILDKDPFWVYINRNL